MAPVDERPLTPGVRTEASLNNSMKRPRGREEDKKKRKEKTAWGLFSACSDPAVAPYHSVHL